MKDLVRKVDVVVGTTRSFFISFPCFFITRSLKSFSFLPSTAAVRRSTYLQTKLRQLCVKLKMPAKTLVKRAPTRWGSMEEQLTVFVELQQVLLYMQAELMFDKCSTPILVPGEDDTPVFKELIDRLRLLKIVGKLLESRDVFTLPHLPYLVYRLESDCKAAIADIRANRTIPLISTIRHKLLEFVQQRLGKHLNDSNQPSLLAAFLTPEYSHRLRDFGVSRQTRKAMLSK